MKAFDYIIVGSGSAGCVLSNCLSEDTQHEVLLIEAGGDDASVLDPRQRKRGVDGLRVADCSVFPIMMAMTMRAADMILEDMRC